jgi:predicted nucleic acid-binding protein
LILVDTSIWIEVFRQRDPLDLATVGEIEEIATCLPVIQEVLQGFRDEWAYRLARRSMLAFPLVEAPLRTELYLEAAQLHRQARRAGLTIRSGVDCLIAACALRAGLTVAHRDRDFDLLARVAPLEVKRLPRRG